MSPSTNKDRALDALLQSLFTDRELRRFLGRFPQANELLSDLPSAPAPLGVLIESTIAMLKRHGLIDPEFFAALVEERPRRREDIEAVASKWVPAPSVSPQQLNKSRTPSYARSLHQLLSMTKIDISSSKNYLTRPIRRLMRLCFHDLTDEHHQDMLRACYVRSSATDTHLAELEPSSAGALLSALGEDDEVDRVDRTSVDPADAIFHGEPRKGVSLVVGPPGSGKSTFFAMLKLQVACRPTGHEAIYLHVDLINNTQLHSSNFDHDRLIDAICGELLDQAETAYSKLSPFQNAVLRKVFAGELRRFRTARSPDSPPPSSEDEDQIILKHLERRKEHLKAWLGFVAREVGPVIVVLDNVDQGTVVFEKVVYQLAADLAHKTDASIAISMRGTTFERGVTGGFLDVRLPTVLQIDPPPFAEVATARVEYIRNELQDDKRLGAQFIRDMRGFSHERVLDFVEILAGVLNRPPARECITALGGGNIREALKLVERYSTSAHTDINKLFRDYDASQGKGWSSPITLDSFLRSVMKGESWVYNEDRAPIVNLLRGAKNATGARFASVRVLQYLDWASQSASCMADTSVYDIIGGMEKFGYESGVIERTVNFLGRERLIVSYDRLEAPWAREDRVRIGSSGRFYIHEILHSREYFLACAFDILLYSEIEAIGLEKIYRKSSTKAWKRSENVARRCADMLADQESQELQTLAAHGGAPVWAVSVMPDIRHHFS